MRYHPQILRGEQAWKNGHLDKNWPIVRPLGKNYGLKRVFGIFSEKFASGHKSPQLVTSNTHLVTSLCVLVTLGNMKRHLVTPGNTLVTPGNYLVTLKLHSSR